MMNYEIFKEVVAEKFMDYMPEQYQGMRLRVEPVNKVNKVLDGITLVGTPISTKRLRNRRKKKQYCRDNR